MTAQELIRKVEEQSKPEYKCKHCIWGKTIIDDRKNDYINIMCMFPTCIKTKHFKKNEEK